MYGQSSAELWGTYLLLSETYSPAHMTARALVVSPGAVAHVAGRPKVAKPARNPHLCSMIPSKDEEEARARKAALLARKISQADEGRVAMADYHRSHQATLDLTAKLKAQRLARDAKPVATEKKAKKAKKAVKRGV